MEMISGKDRIEMLAGTMLVGGVVLFILHVVTLNTLGRGNETIMLVLAYGLVVLVAGILMDRILAPFEPTLAALGTFGLVSHGLLVILVCALIIARFRLEGEFGDREEFSEELVAMGVRAINLIMDQIRTAAFFLLGFGTGAMGLIILRNGALKLRKWFGWLGLVVGFIGFGITMTLFFVPEVGMSRVVVIVSILSMLAYLLALGLQMVVYRPAADAKLEIQGR